MAEVNINFQNIILGEQCWFWPFGIFVNIISSSLYKFAASADGNPKEKNQSLLLEQKISLINFISLDST